jgi:hypothetical protein
MRVEDEVRAMGAEAIEMSRLAVPGGREQRPAKDHGGMLALEVENLRLTRLVAELLMKNQQLREELRTVGV